MSTSIDYARTLIFVPTYNERDNVGPLYEAIRYRHPANPMVFLDDNSPDGTGQILDELAQKDDNLEVIHRQGKEGIGSAHQVGIEHAYRNGYQTLITMDCDFTHRPEDIQDFMDNADGCQIVVGSRYHIENGVKDWNPWRKFLTNFGHLLTKHLLNIPQDATGAFRLYRLDLIDSAMFKKVTATGYSFFFESLYVMVREGVKITEVPITLPKRAYGTSKMKVSDMVSGIIKLLGLYLKHRQSRS